jgi:hypothetical protein
MSEEEERKEGTYLAGELALVSFFGHTERECRKLSRNSEKGNSGREPMLS